MESKCINYERNKEFCRCPHPECDKHVMCCDCLQYHLKRRELPVCIDTTNVDKILDKDLRAYVELKF